MSQSCLLPRNVLFFDKPGAPFKGRRMPAEKCGFPILTACGREILEVDAFRHGQKLVGRGRRFSVFDLMVMRFIKGASWSEIGRQSGMWPAIVEGHVRDALIAAYEAQIIRRTATYKGEA